MEPENNQPMGGGEMPKPPQQAPTSTPPVTPQTPPSPTPPPVTPPPAPAAPMTPPPPPRDPATPKQMKQMPEEKKSSIGPTVGIIIVVVLLILGGLYFWGGQLLNQGANPDEILGASDPISENLGNISTSDEISDLEAELDTTDLDNLDQELADIDAELGI